MFPSLFGVGGYNPAANPNNHPSGQVNGYTGPPIGSPLAWKPSPGLHEADMSVGGQYGLGPGTTPSGATGGATGGGGGGSSGGASSAMQDQLFQWLLSQATGAQQHDWNVQDTGTQNQYNDFESTKNNNSGQVRDVAGKGYLDPSQIAAGKGDYTQTLADLAGQRPGLQNIADNGLFSAADNQQFNQDYGQAHGSASNLAATGGVDPGEWAALMGQFGANEGRLGATADRGALTGDEYNNDLASAQQDVEDKYRGAAESTYNSGNIGGSPFAGAALLSKGATEGGKARASAKTGLDQFQANTRLQAANDLSGLIGTHSEADLGLGRNKIAGQGTLNELINTLSSRQNQSGQGKLDANRILAQLTGQEGDIASKLSTLDTSGMPDYIKQILAQAQTGAAKTYAPPATSQLVHDGGGNRTYTDKKGRNHVITRA